MSDLVLGSTVIYVESGVNEVLEFYREAFGLAIRYYDDGLKFGELETGGPTIMIASYAAAEYLVGEPFRRSLGSRPDCFEIAFFADDVATAFAKAVAAGASPVESRPSCRGARPWPTCRASRELSSVSSPAPSSQLRADVTSRDR